MDIQAEINEIHQEIDKVKDATFVEKIKYFLLPLDSAAGVPTIDYNNDIEKGQKVSKNVDFHSDIKIRSISKKWGRI